MGPLSAFLAFTGTPMGKVAGALGVALIIGGLLIAAYVKGRTDQAAINAAAAAKELERQIGINDRQRATFRRLADTLNQHNIKLEARLDDLNNQAHRDPGATSNRISADSVRRINGIR